MIRLRNLGSLWALCVLLMLFAPFLGGGGNAARAQDKPLSSGPDNPPLPTPARSLEQDESEPPAYFVEVRDALKAKLASKQLDPGKQAFHFVVLYNATVPLSAGYGKEREVLAGMLRHFLASSDHVSFVPYQLWVRADHADWNMAFSKDAAEQLYKHIPDKPETREGFEGGHDLDAALIEAIRKTQEMGLLDNTVFIALADGQFADTPLKPLHYPLANADAALNKADLSKVDEKTHFWKFGGQDNAAQFSTTYRLYLPANLKPLDAIKQSANASRPENADIQRTPRDESSDAIWGKSHASQTPATTPDTKPNMKPVMQDPKPKPKTKIDPTPQDYTGLFAVLGGLAALGGVGAYLAFLFRARTVNIGVNNLTSAKVTFNKPLILGAYDNPKGNVVKIDSLPPSVAATEKIARLEVTPMGTLRLRAMRWKPDKDPTILQAKTSKVRLSRDKTTQTIGSGETITVQIIKTK